MPTITYPFTLDSDTWEIEISYEREPPDYSVGIGPAYDWSVEGVPADCPLTAAQVERKLDDLAVQDACDEHFREGLR